MGNEMGNNNTTTIKEEDNISEDGNKNLLEDTSEHANGISQDAHADNVREENHIPSSSIAKDVMEKDSNSSNDIKVELGKDTPQEDGHADDAKGKIQTIPTSMLGNDLLEGYTHASEINMENQMHPTAEAEDVKDKATGLAFEDTTAELEEVSLQEESHGDEVKDKIQMMPTAEAKDIEEKATGLISNNSKSMIENDSLEGDTDESDMNMENQMHPTDESEDVQETATGMASDHTRSSLENDLLKGEDDYDDKTSELEGKLQEDKQDGNMIIPFTNNIDVQGKNTILASDDPMNLRKSSGGEGEEMTGVRQPEKSPYAESVEGENYESLSSSSLEGTEECGKQEDSCLIKHQSLIYNHHLSDQSSIKQDEEETMVLTLNSVNASNDSELHESPSVNHDELVRSLSEHSLQGTESLLKDTLLDADSHLQLIKDDVSEIDMECQEKMLCANKSDSTNGNEFGNGLIDTSEATSDPPSIGNNNNNGNLLTKINYTTVDCLNNPFPESFVMDISLKSDHEETFKVLDKENNISIYGSINENPQNYKPDQCMEELKEYKSDMVNTYELTIGSNGDSNGAKHTVLGSSVFDIANSDLVEEPNVTENGLQSDAYVNNFNKAPEEKHSVVPEAGEVFLIAGSTVVDCRHDKGENHNNKIEDTKENPQASYAMVKTFEETDMSEQFNSDLVTINHEECFSLQNSDSLLHIYNYHQGNAEQTRSSTATVEKLDSSKLTVPSLDLVDEEAIEKEREDYSQHAEATSLIVAELTTSAATILANSGYQTRDSITRLSTESNPDNPNISCQIQKSPSFNLNLRMEARPEESDQTPLLYQANEILSKQTDLNLSNTIPHAEYGECILHNVDMPVEEKIVTMERSYSEISKAPFIGLLKEEAHLMVMEQTQDNHAGTKNAVKEVSSTSPEGKEKRKSRSYFFSSCMCCATVAN